MRTTKKERRVGVIISSFFSFSFLVSKIILQSTEYTITQITPDLTAIDK